MQNTAVLARAGPLPIGLKAIAGHPRGRVHRDAGEGAQGKDILEDGPDDLPDLGDGVVGEVSEIDPLALTIQYRLAVRVGQRHERGPATRGGGGGPVASAPETQGVEEWGTVGIVGSAGQALDEVVQGCRQVRVEAGNFREMEHREGMAEPLAPSGRVEAARGDHALARVLYEDSLAMAREIDDQELIASGLAGLVSVAAVQGEPARAVRLWGNTDALREAIGASLQPIERADYDQALAAVRDHLGEAAFVSAWAQGRTMTAEQVLTTRV